MDPCPDCGLEHPAGVCALRATQLGTPVVQAPDAEARDRPTQLAASQDGISALPAVDAPARGELAPGMLVGDYEVVRRVGEGGMGTVYEAVHPLIGRRVAIKVIRDEVCEAGGAAAARFLQEARTASMLRQRNIVDVFAFGQLVDGRSYLVMEFLDGESLAERIERRGPLSFREALPIVSGVLAALKAAHDKGVVHRDLKPENIWILPPDPGSQADGADDEVDEVIDPALVKLLDFGLAKLTADAGNARLTRAGAMLGTPAFMSPEQCRGDANIDRRADLYSLGVILFEMFSRELPFRGESYVEVMSQQLAAPPPSLEDLVAMPPALEEVIFRALAKDPAERYQDAVEFREALVSCTEAMGWSPRAPGRVVAPDDGETQIGDPPRPRAVEGFPVFDHSGFGIEPVLKGRALTLVFRGELEGAEGALALGAYFGAVAEAAGERADPIARIVLDLTAVGYLDTEGLSCLGDWLAFLREARAADGLAPTTLRYAASVHWQRSALASLGRVDPALMLESIG